VDDARYGFDEGTLFEAQVIRQLVEQLSWGFDVLRESAIGVDTELSEFITQQLLTVQTVEAGTAAHVDIRGHPVAFLEPVAVLANFGNHA
jgi:hypothetical protein